MSFYILDQNGLIMWLFNGPIIPHRLVQLPLPNPNTHPIKPHQQPNLEPKPHHRRIPPPHPLYNLQMQCRIRPQIPTTIQHRHVQSFQPDDRIRVDQCRIEEEIECPEAILNEDYEGDEEDVGWGPEENGDGGEEAQEGHEGDVTPGVLFVVEVGDYVGYEEQRD